MDTVYLDFAATTPVRSEVVESISPYFETKFGNPSSLYLLAEEARNAMALAREQAASALSANINEIVFTSGATEANNMAIKGGAFALQQAGKRIVVSSIEHSSVRYTAEQLARWGWQVNHVQVDSNGCVDPAAVYELIDRETTVVSIGMVNSEIGTIQDIKGISEKVQQRAREFGTNIIMHTDATQAMGKLELNVDQLGVEMLSLSGHKIYAPKGVGLLYVKRGTPLEPLIVGGGQERQRRAGTENVAGIVGMGLAMKLIEEEREEFVERSSRYLRQLKQGIEKISPSAIFNGYDGEHIPNILNVSFPGISGEALLIDLDFAGVSASSGSACSSASLEPSDVLVSIGLDADIAVSSVRFSIGRTTTKADIETVLEKLSSVLHNIQSVQSVV